MSAGLRASRALIGPDPTLRLPGLLLLPGSMAAVRLQRLPLPGPNKGKTKIHFPLSESREGESGESHSLLCSGAHTAPYISLELKIRPEF